MQVAGIRAVGARVELIDVDEPRPLAGDEVLLEVMAAGVGNWDEFVRTGGWDVGTRPPMALGVEAAGTVVAAGPAAGDWAPGDPVMTHPVPLRDQGTWAPRLIAPAGLLAPPAGFVHLVVGYDGSAPAGRRAPERQRGGLGVHAAPGHRRRRADRGGHRHPRCPRRGDRGDCGREFVPRRSLGNRLDRRQPGPSFAGAPCYRAVAARRNRGIAGIEWLSECRLMPGD